MVVCREIEEIKREVSLSKAQNQTIGLVPTMGALHDGHLSLIESAKLQNNLVIGTIFVNPAQFNNQNDYKSYPIDLDEDIQTMKQQGVSIVFTPQSQEIYPEQEIIKLSFGNIERHMEGKFRPGHFSGVGIVLSKLFNIIKPDKAYFGQKDLQQVSIVKKLVNDLFFDLEIVVVPTVREPDGLAASSRNRRLNSEQRKTAVIFYQTLNEAKKRLLDGDTIKNTTDYVKQAFGSSESVDLEYFDVVESDTLNPVKDINPTTRISLCIAGYVGEVRLLDNIYLN